MAALVDLIKSWFIGKEAALKARAEKLRAKLQAAEAKIESLVGRNQP